MLARSGRRSDAQKKLDTLIAAGAQIELITKLKAILDEVGSSNPAAAREELYAKTGELTDLISLVDLLRKDNLHEKLVVFAKELFSQTVPKAMPKHMLVRYMQRVTTARSSYSPKNTPNCLTRLVIS